MTSSRLAHITSVRGLAVVAFLLGAAVVLAYRPFSQTVRGDCAIYDYIAQSILRGQMPYRDAIDPKAPAGMYFSAMAMAIGKSIGMRDVIAVRWLHVLMAALLSAITFLVAEAYLRSRIAALIAFLVPLLTDNFVLMMNKGTQPKLPMMVCLHGAGGTQDTLMDWGQGMLKDLAEKHGYIVVTPLGYAPANRDERRQTLVARD